MSSNTGASFPGYRDAVLIGEGELRYWDGAGWTAHVSRHGVVSLDPL